MTVASARIVAAASATVYAVLSSVCTTAVDNSGVYVYYLKGIVSVCFRCPARTVGFSEFTAQTECSNILGITITNRTKPVIIVVPQ